jgi:diguanylate cyclase
MRYPQTPAESAELLRLVLPRIAKYGGHYAPTSYSVWYEHLAGLNKPLSEELDSRLQATQAIGQPDIEQLYERHVSVRENRSAVVLQDGLSELLRKLVDIAATSGEGTAEYARALESCERELGSVGDTEGLQRVIKSLISSTSAARSATEKVQAELEAGRAEMQQLRERLGNLQSEALSDPLTGLHNRRGFERTLAELYGEGSDGLSSAALLLADIDHFKKVNDSYGHLVGDQVIRACGQVLKGAVKGRDIVARFGGEEFVVLLPDTPGHGALALAEQIRGAFGKLRIRRSGSDELIAQVSISIGVATPLPGESVEQAIDRADKALYRAKSEGRNCVRFADNAAAA